MDETMFDTGCRVGEKTGLGPVSICEEGNHHVFPLMDLPFEIRLQIYRWIHRLHPVKQAQLTPWYPTPVYSSYFLKIVRPGQQLSVDEYDRAPPALMPLSAAVSRRMGNGEQATLLSPYRPLAGLPTSLLRANKQLYQECREIPLLDNEFAFVNWFASGLWAARSFVRGLRPWQQEKMRYVRLEVLSRDLTGLYAKEWQELCGLWSSGLRGLRLKILSGGGSWVADVLPSPRVPAAEARDCDGKMQHWVEHGLNILTQLRFLEVELLVADMDDEKKVAWCNTLEDTINQHRSKSQQISVVCVERR